MVKILKLGLSDLGPGLFALPQHAFHLEDKSVEDGGSGCGVTLHASLSTWNMLLAYPK